MELAINFKVKFSVILILTLLFSCKKAEDRRCWKSAGITSEKRVDVSSFTRLKLNKKLNYTLVADDSTYLVLKGGKHLLSFISTSFPDSQTLSIENDNKCAFLRDYASQVEVEIHYVTLDKIDYLGSGFLRNKDTLKVSSLLFAMYDASGSVDLCVNINQLSFTVAEGSGDFKLRGKTYDTNLNIRDNAYGEALDLKTTNNLTVISKTNGDFYVNVDQCNVSGYLSRKGNVYYKGTPNFVHLELLGEGKFLPY